MRTYFLSAWRVALVAAGLSVPIGIAFAAPPAVGPNVNMVTGTQWPEGDPFLTKQNEPSLAVSSRNARHLLAGANDYRLVPVEIAETLDDPEAWVQIFKSVDGGQSWRGTPLGGCPLSIPECADSTGLTAKLLGLHPNFGADPTVRAGPYGTFFLSFIAGTRNTNANGVVAVQRFVDKNNDIQRATDVRPCTQGTTGCRLVSIPDGCTPGTQGCTTQYLALKPAQDPILPDVLNIIDVGTPGQGKDKPWVAADVGGRSWNAGKTCELLTWTKGRTDVTNAAETVPAFNVYVSYANFTGNGAHPSIFVAASSDCGKTFGKPQKVSQSAHANQGTSSAVDPLTGAVYVVWRNFDGPQQIMMAKSTNGGVSWIGPVVVAKFNAYDQGATGVSFRTLGFPSVAVSVSGGVSRVHVAWTQRKVAPNATAPYACPAADPAQCDARMVVATSKDGGVTWPAPMPVDSAYTVNLNLPNGSVYSHQRGHQLQPSLTFIAGKLLATWVDSRLDHSEGYLTCKASVPNCTSVSDMVESRRPAKNSNLDPACHIDVSSPPLSTLPPATRALYNQCNHPEAVWTPYVTDGTTGLVRRHTVDVYSAMADPADAPVFTSSRVSQYTFGTTVQSVQGTVHPGDPITPKQGTYDIVQKEVNAPNLPMFSAGKSAFMGDYIDSAGQLIVATTGDSQHPYKFNVGGGASGPFVTSGFAPAFHVAFTDNRDVIPPLSGDWSSPTCLTTAFKKDANGNIIGVDTSGGAACQSGYSGNRNQNVYTAAIVENSVAFANANSKALDATTERAYSVTVRNMSSDPHNYQLTLVQGPGTTASFHSATPLTQNIIVQPRSSSARTVWVKGSSTGTVEIDVKSTDSNWVPDGVFVTKVLLNPDSSAPLVANGDGGPATTDTAPDNFGNVVMTNAVMTNYLLANNPLTAAVMSNNAMTNAAMSNVVFSNAAMTNDAAANAAMSNVVMSNAVMTNNAMTNAVMSNVVMTNNTLNAAMTNLDPTNVAMSNAVMSNNAMTNVALTNGSVGNVVMTNNAMTNAVMSNVVMSNVAMTNNAMTNDPLRYAVMTNAPLSDPSGGTVPDADPLRSVEVGAVEIAQNPFLSSDLANSNFKETTFAIRNRGNVDTTLAIKMLLRDAVCSGAPSYTCTTPPGYKLQLVLRKVSMLPVAIPPTGPAVSNIGGVTRAIRIGLTQSNVEVSNVSDLPLVDPSDPNFGKFLPDDPKAAMLTLASGEYAYATIRAIGVGGATPPDPADLLQWGVKTVASNATNANGPLVIRTLNFPAAPAFVALTAASPTLQAFGGKAPISGSVACSDQFGNIVLSGVGAPTSNFGIDGNLYIDTPAQMLYGPKTLGAWGNGRALIQPPDANHPTPWASVTCPPGPFGVAPAIGPFTTDASFNSTANITFTPTYWGDFYLRTGVADASSPTQTDQQVIKVHVNPRPPVLSYATSNSDPNFPTCSLTSGFQTTQTFNNNSNSVSLAGCVSSDSKNGAGVKQSITLTASGGACTIPDNDHLFITNATVGTGFTCVVTVHQGGNEIFDQATQFKNIVINKANSTIVFGTAPSNVTYGNNPVMVTATTSSTTAPPSVTAMTFTSRDTSICSVVPGSTTNLGSGLWSASIAINSGLTCIIDAAQNEPANSNYNPAQSDTTAPLSFVIAKADQKVTFGATPVGLRFGDLPFGVTAGVATINIPPHILPTAPDSGEPITFSSTTPLVCSVNVSGTTVTILAKGTCTINGSVPGDTTRYNPANTLVDITILPALLNVTASVSPTSFVYGDDVPPGPIPITTGSSFTITPPTAPCNTTAFASTQSGVPAAPANVGTYNITANVTSMVNANCTVVPTDATLTVTQAPTRFTVPAQFFTSLGSPTTIAGKLNRTGKPTVFPAGPMLITVQQGANPPLSFPSTQPTPSAPDGAFSVADGPPPTIPSDSYKVTFSFAGSSNFQAASNVVSVLRIEGFSSAGSMNTARAHHATVLLQDGRVLTTGGKDATGTATNMAEIYCPDTLSSPPPGCTSGVASFLSTMSMNQARVNHTATVLPSGKVIVFGGAGAASPDEIWDPATQAWTSAITSTARKHHTATLLSNGNVFIAGGNDTAGTTLNTTVIYDPTTGTSVAGPNLQTPRERHTATLLLNGTVLISGGGQAISPTAFNVWQTAEIFDPVASTTTTVAPTMMGDPRFVQSDVLLDDGRALIAGGSSDGTTALASADFFGTGAFTPLPGAPNGALVQARASFSMTKLTDSWVLAAGGGDSSGNCLASSELFEPGPGFDLFATGASMTFARAGHTATRLLDGRILVLGGTGANPGPGPGPCATVPPININSAEFYNGPF